MLDLVWLLKSWCFHFTIALACLLDPELGEHHFLRTASNIRIHYVAKGDTGKPLMLCIHGFPEVMYTRCYCFIISTVIAADVFVNPCKAIKKFKSSCHLDLEVQGFVIWSLNFIDEVYHTLRETKNTLRGLTPIYHLKKLE